MINEEIADIFEMMSRVLAFKGANRFRALAYERSARSVVNTWTWAKRDGEPSGFVHLEGAYLNKRGDEIRHFFRLEAEREAEDYPLAKIIRGETDEKGRPTLATTTEHLAQRLGHALEKAFKGAVRYDFSHENKLAHVYWRRD